MQYDELTQTITTSTPADWARIDADGGLFLDMLGEVSSSEQRWLEVSTHQSMAVYRNDIDLRLAWGLTTGHDLTFEHWVFPDRGVDRLAVDAFWRGALVNRWTVLEVDGGRCYLPDPSRVTVKTGDGPTDVETVGWEAPASEIALARLVNNLSRTGGREFDSYLKQAEIRTIPGE